MFAEKLITDHIDIWTSAVQAKSSSGRGSGKKRELYGIKKLRELILELAVRGKLVPQDPSDEPASVLLERIAAEKAQLVKEKKIKKPKALPKISNEKPFSVPESWTWTQLGFVTNYGVCEKAESKDVQDSTWVLELEDVEKSTSKLLRKVRFEDRSFESSKNVFLKKDVIYGKLRPYLDKVIVADEAGVCTTEMIPMRGYCDFSPEFLRLVLKTPYFIEYANSSTHGMNLPRMGTDKAREALIPLAPINEQHRVVAKVDELMALCDQLEQQTEASLDAHQVLVETLLATLTNSQDATELMANWARVSEHFDTLFTTEQSIDQLKQTILQLAVMGKLVPQDPNDEPAAILLERIAEEKAQLVKEKKIKKQKALPPIADDEKPFELPKGWEWCRLGEIYDVSSSKRIHVKDYVENGIPFFRSKEIGELGRGNDISTELFISHNQYDALRYQLGFPHPNDLMLASIGGSIGNNWIADERPFYYKDGNITKISHHSLSNPKFLKLFVDSALFWKQVNNGVAGSAYNALTIIKIQNLVFPLPPLEEQLKIVTKVEELCAICEEVKQRLRDSQQTQLQLTDAIVEQAL
ncbi:restriction endonuclease subunit S [Vibrio cholerae]|nr:restriction endonuclease subunit S [Vibrio cholerae]EGR4420143.1 restriction endonuclease subunit S [Vibrio cholerae]EGR4430833.1 restriction endonuclease subunit S [Vibrio cholerae]HAS5576532.1 restriction endonuclease subunit S [Vibrio cholerae]